MTTALNIASSDTPCVSARANRGDAADIMAVHSRLVGGFRFYLADELWEWSAEAAQMHGYPAAEMSRTIDQVMSHVHPDDRRKVAAALDFVRRTRSPISSRHRIIDAQGSIHDIEVLSQELDDDAGNLIGSEGFYVDLTSSALLLKQEEREREQQVSDNVAHILESRTVIDEVKGMLMLIYRIDDQQAFELLRWRSQVTNTKLRTLAEKLRDQFVQLAYTYTVPSRSHFDHLLLTGHERTAPGIARR